MALATGVGGGASVGAAVAIGSVDAGLRTGVDETDGSVGSPTGVGEGSGRVGASVAGTALTVDVDSDSVGRTGVGRSSVGGKETDCGVGCGELAVHEASKSDASRSTATEHRLTCMSAAPLLC